MTVPQPNHPGEVVQAPVYIRVRPNWLERWLFIAVLVQILLVIGLIAFGSTAARKSLDLQKQTRMLLCERIYDVSPDQYKLYTDVCPARLPNR